MVQVQLQGRLVRANSKTANKRAAEQIEAAKKTQLAEREVGIEGQGAMPYLG